jgi:hypothetical protein
VQRRSAALQHRYLHALLAQPHRDPGTRPPDRTPARGRRTARSVRRRSSEAGPGMPDSLAVLSQTAGSHSRTKVREATASADAASAARTEHPRCRSSRALLALTATSGSCAAPAAPTRPSDRPSTSTSPGMGTELDAEKEVAATVADARTRPVHLDARRVPGPAGPRWVSSRVSRCGGDGGRLLGQGGRRTQLPLLGHGDAAGADGRPRQGGAATPSRALPGASTRLIVERVTLNSPRARRRARRQRLVQSGRSPFVPVGPCGTLRR